jgi:hypothetical protein
MADYLARTARSGNLRGICPDCHRLIYRAISLCKIAQLRGELDIQIPETQQHIEEGRSPSLNCHFALEHKTHEND